MPNWSTISTSTGVDSTKLEISRLILSEDAVGYILATSF